MLFPTLNFAIFFLVVFTASWLLMPHRTAWKWFMLAASWYFYANWDWRFVALIAGSSLVNQLLGVAISRTDEPGRRKALVTGAVAANLVVLGVFKYYGFFAESVADMLGTVGVESPVPFLRFILPVGISFLTFHAISYVVDIYRGELAPAPALDFFVYMAFFPHLVAGPIVRGSELLPQFRTRGTRADRSEPGFLADHGRSRQEDRDRRLSGDQHRRRCVLHSRPVLRR